MNEEKHAVFSPSAAKRWINCPGSINLCKDLPRQKPNFYSAEGTVAHLLAADRLSNNAQIKYGQCIEGEFPITITDEMLDAVMVYVAFVRNQINKYDEQPEIERKVKITDDCFGTADSIIYSPYRILIINDYKHGAGIQVDAEMNEQMMIYALGKLCELPIDEQHEIPKIQLNIIQPRGSGEAIRTFEISMKDLRKWDCEILLPAYRKAQEHNAPLNPGEWCKYCPAALICPALKKENLAVAKMAFQDPVQWIDVMTPKQVGELLDKQNMVMAFYKKLNEYAAELASKNTKIPGYIYEKKWGNRKWKDEEAARLQLVTLYGEEPRLFAPAKLVSPAQFEKIFKKELDMSSGNRPEFLELVEKPFTGYALKKANGKEITVKEIFNEIE